MRISHSTHRFLDRLGPYQSLLILAIPLAIVEPFKIGSALCGWWWPLYRRRSRDDLRLRGKSFYYRARLFVVLKPKLLTLPWFALAWRWFVTVRDKFIYWLRRTDVMSVPAGTPKPVSALVGESHVAHR